MEALRATVRDVTGKSAAFENKLVAEISTLTASLSQAAQEKAQLERRLQDSRLKEEALEVRVNRIKKTVSAHSSTRLSGSYYEVTTVLLYLFRH